MSYIYNLAWLLSGLAGSLLLWLNWAMWFSEYWFSPKRIFMIVLGTLTGPLTLVGALVIWSIDPPTEYWWTRPIRRRNK